MKNTLSKISRLQALAEKSPYPHEAEAAKKKLEKLLAEQDSRLKELSDTCTEGWQRLLIALFSDLDLDRELAEKSLEKLTEMWNVSLYRGTPEYAAGIFSGVLDFLRYELYEDSEEAWELIEQYERVYEENFGGYDTESDDIRSFDIKKRHSRARHSAGDLRGGAVIRRVFGEEYSIGYFDLIPDEYWIDDADNKYMRNKLRSEMSYPLSEEDRKKLAEYEFNPPEGNSRWKNLCIRNVPYEKKLLLSFFGLAAAVSGCLAGRLYGKTCVFASVVDSNLEAVENLGREFYALYLEGEKQCRKRLKGQKLAGFYKLFRWKFGSELSGLVSQKFYPEYESDDFPKGVPHSSAMTMVSFEIETYYTNWKENPFRLLDVETDFSELPYDAETVIETADETALKIWEKITGKETESVTEC